MKIVLLLTRLTLRTLSTEAPLSEVAVAELNKSRELLSSWVGAAMLHWRRATLELIWGR
jgi:hypothetical protein